MGCSPVGCILIQLARLWGAHVTAVTSLRGIPVIQALGAHDVVVCDEGADVQGQLTSREGYKSVYFCVQDFHTLTASKVFVIYLIIKVLFPTDVMI
jgi:NADPH:quinone reductase-like Zn-dependent oxidoreductase